MKRILCLCSLMSVLMLAGCYDPHAQDSQIVREVEAAGAGNISTYTYQGLGQWLAQRPELAKKIAAECVPIAQKAPANWLTTAEGTTCHAAQVVAPPPEIKADTKAW